MQQSPQVLAHPSGLQSPASSSLHSPIDHEQPSDLIPNWNPHHTSIREQAIFHLVPCTWQEFLKLKPRRGSYDYIDGLAVYTPNVADTERKGLSKAHSIILECSNVNLYVYPTPSLQVLSCHGRKDRTVDEKDPSDSTSPSPSAQQADRQSTFGLRHPDYSITATTRGDSGTSSTSKDPDVTMHVKHPYPYSHKLLGIAEFTRPSTRTETLYTKWAEYALSQVPVYLIFDLGTKTYCKQVIVGALAQFSDATKSWHGDPDKTTRTPPDEAPTYYKKVYKPTDFVDCPMYANFMLTATNLLDRRTMRKLARKMHFYLSDLQQRGERVEYERR